MSPIVSDWTRSGTTKVGIFRNGLWLVDYTAGRLNGSNRSYVHEQAYDLPSLAIGIAPAIRRKSDLLGWSLGS